jgi:hypothetical protein
MTRSTENLTQRECSRFVIGMSLVPTLTGTSSILTGFPFFSQSLQANAGIVPRLAHDRFLQNFTILLSTCRENLDAERAFLNIKYYCHNFQGIGIQGSSSPPFFPPLLISSYLFWPSSLIVQNIFRKSITFILFTCFNHFFLFLDITQKEK